jgi:hypothetical protein
MKINRVVFCGKSKKKTGNTRFMHAALKRRVKDATFLNIPRLKRRYFWKDYRDIIYKKIRRENPDLVLVYSKDVPNDVLKKINKDCKTAIFYPDLVVPPDPDLVSAARLVDHLFITNKTQIPQLKEMGVKDPSFCMQGCDRDAHRIIPTNDEKWVSEVAFIGMPKPERIELLRAIDKKFHLKTWGAKGKRWRDFGLSTIKENIYPRDYAMICSAAKIVLGCDIRYDIECWFSNRTWITLGCGGFLLTNYVPGLETIFTRGVHLEWYRDIEECLELVDYYLKHEDERKKIARAGYEFAHATRTYDVVMDEIISTIEGG